MSSVSSSRQSSAGSAASAMGFVGSSVGAAAARGRGGPFGASGVACKRIESTIAPLSSTFSFSAPPASYPVFGHPAPGTRRLSGIGFFQRQALFHSLKLEHYFLLLLFALPRISSPAPSIVNTPNLSPPVVLPVETPIGKSAFTSGIIILSVVYMVNTDCRGSCSHHGPLLIWLMLCQNPFGLRRYRRASPVSAEAASARQIGADVAPPLPRPAGPTKVVPGSVRRR